MNQFPASQGILTPESAPDLLNKAIQAIWMRRDEFTSNLKQLFETIPLEHGKEHIFSSVSSVVGLPEVTDDTDPISYANPAPGFKQTYTMVTYVKGVRVTDQAIRFDRFGKIVAMVSGLVKSAMRKEEYSYAGVINGGFATAKTADAAYLFSASHLHENPEAGTYSNLATGALTTSNLQSMRLKARKMTNDLGFPDPVLMTKLLVEPTLEQKALELTQSFKRADDSLNAETVLINNLEVIVSPFLSSTTAYFGIGDRKSEDKGLIKVELMAPEMADNRPARVDIKIDRRIKMIYAVGAYQGKNIYGSTGL